MFMFILFTVIIFILTATGALGIFLSRKSILVKKITSKPYTIFFLILLNILVFFGELSAGRSGAYAFGHTLGYVWVFSFLPAALAVLLINKFKSKEKEIWHSWFFVLLWVLAITIKDYIL